MRIAAIDIGTNTILMLIANVENGTILDIIRDEHTIARIGEGVDSQRNISPDALKRLRICLKEYVRIARSLDVDRIVACGTSALRDAGNAKEIVQHVRTSFDLEITILSKEDEATMTYVGALSGLTRLDDISTHTVIDIGGGSTEIAFGKRTSIESHASLDVGSVRLTERFLQKYPPTSQSMHTATAFIQDLLRSAPSIPSDSHFIGVAGTLTTLSSLYLGIRTYEGRRIEGFRLTTKMVEGSFERLRDLSLEEIVAIPQIPPQRADIILAGVLILRELLNHYEQDSITVSNRGLRFGILLREAAIAKRN
jgi:exopolyphosphatase/guanosine-5'-triphosphate,3'-diphosphate pyrophosphatase